MIIRNVEEMIQDIKQNITRLNRDIKNARYRHSIGELKPKQFESIENKLVDTRYAYEHCLEMAQALQHSQLVSQAYKELSEPSDKEKAQQFFDSMSQGSIPKSKSDKADTNELRKQFKVKTKKQVLKEEGMDCI